MFWWRKKNKIYVDILQHELFVHSKTIPFVVPDGYFLNKHSKGWLVREIFEFKLGNQKAYPAISCDGEYFEEKYVVQHKEKINICELCQHKMKCVVGNTRKQFKVIPSFQFEKEMGIVNLTEKLKKE